MSVIVKSVDFFAPGVAVALSHGDELSVNTGVLVASTGVDTPLDQDYGVYTDVTQNLIINAGGIVAATANAVELDLGSDLATISNEPGAFISGHGNGILADSGGDRVDNQGGIFGLIDDGIVFAFASHDIRLTNYGLVAGSLTGVVVESQSGGGAIIDNFGSISGSTLDGINILTASSVVTHVTNAAGATITGPQDAIFVATGGLALTNAGTLNGGVDCTNGSATGTITNTGTINGTVTLDGPVDLFNGRNGTSADIVTGPGHDTVLVGKGNTTVHIDDAGSSALTAGRGPDTFFFDDGLGGGNVVIHHFNPLIDRIELSEKFFPGLGPVGKLHAGHFGIDGNVHNTDPQIVYNDHTGLLYYDSNGDLPGGRADFAKLAPHPALTKIVFVKVFDTDSITSDGVSPSNLHFDANPFLLV